MSGLKLISRATTESYSERTENKELYLKVKNNALVKLLLREHFLKISQVTMSVF